MTIVVKTKLKEMPKDCAHCFADYTTDCLYLTCYEEMPRRDGSRPDNCPLMEVDDAPEGNN